MRRARLRTLATTDRPTTVVCGREDTPCPVSHHELMAGRLPLSCLVVVEDSGHPATLEQPDIATKVLISLIGR